MNEGVLKFIRNENENENEVAMLEHVYHDKRSVRNSELVVL